MKSQVFNFQGFSAQVRFWSRGEDTRPQPGHYPAGFLPLFSAGAGGALVFPPGALLGLGAPSVVDALLPAIEAWIKRARRAAEETAE